jgi:guanine deaminase
MLAAGTTTCQAFTCTFPVATEVFFEEASRRNLRVIGGLTGIDRLAPPEFMDSAENFYRDTKRLIGQYHKQERNLHAITPRFAAGATPQLLSACTRLLKEYPDCWLNTHVSENPSEIRTVRAKYPECNDYLGVYEKYELVGPRFSGGHGVWLPMTSSHAFLVSVQRWCSAHYSTSFWAADFSALDELPIRIAG